MEIKTFNNPPDNWNKFVEEHPHGRIYHLTRWNELIRNIFKRSIKYMVLENSKGLEGVLPLTEFNSKLFGKFSISLPFINYGGPLFKNEDQYLEFTYHLSSYRKKENFDFVELRMDNFYETDLQVKTHKVTFIIKLRDNPDELYNSFKSKLRSQIRRPLKEGIYSRSGSINLINDFYKVYSINMRDLGTPALPKTFFKNVIKTFPDETSIVCVYTKDSKPIAASFLIKYKSICEIPWASSLRRYNRLSPNMLLYWESLKNAIESGCQSFDMGRCSPDSGSYQFKKQWGAEEKSLFWYYFLSDSKELPELNPNNPKYRLLIKTWQKLPVMISNSLSPFIIKNIP